MHRVINTGAYNQSLLSRQNHHTIRQSRRIVVSSATTTAVVVVVAPHSRTAARPRRRLGRLTYDRDYVYDDDYYRA